MTEWKVVSLVCNVTITAYVTLRCSTFVLCIRERNVGQKQMIVRGNLELPPGLDHSRQLDWPRLGWWAVRSPPSLSLLARRLFPSPLPAARRAADWCRFYLAREATAGG